MMKLVVLNVDNRDAYQYLHIYLGLKGFNCHLVEVQDGTTLPFRLIVEEKDDLSPIVRLALKTYGALTGIDLTHCITTR